MRPQMFCDDHGEWNPDHESGCPTCVAEMRQDIRLLLGALRDIAHEKRADAVKLRLMAAQAIVDFQATEPLYGK